MTAYNIIPIMGTIFSLTLVSTCDHIVLQIREEKEIRQCLNEAHARLEMGKIYANGCLHLAVYITSTVDATMVKFRRLFSK